MPLKPELGGFGMSLFLMTSFEFELMNQLGNLIRMEEVGLMVTGRPSIRRKTPQTACAEAEEKERKEGSGEEEADDG